MLDNMESEQILVSKMSKAELMEAIEQVHAEFGLNSNTEQSHAFHIAAEHFAFNTVKQLLLFITGIGRSGKSHVIKAIITLFDVVGVQKKKTCFSVHLLAVLLF